MAKDESKRPESRTPVEDRVKPGYEDDLRRLPRSGGEDLGEPVTPPSPSGRRKK